jgi:serine/threonine-protein kinase RsbW
MKNNKYPYIEILIIPSNLNELSKVERFSQKISKKATLSEEKSDNLAIVLTELVNNAIIHGNKLITGKKVFIKASLFKDRLEVIIKDQGKGFEPKQIANPTNPENLWKESGRGIFLVQNLIDAVEYIPTENGMEIKIIEYLN